MCAFQTWKIIRGSPINETKFRIRQVTLPPFIAEKARHKPNVCVMHRCQQPGLPGKG